MQRSPLGLHLPDADHLTTAEAVAARDLKPAAMLAMLYAQWDKDKGASATIRQLVRELSHDRLYVRFHADPHPPGYAKSIGGATNWGRLCARRMTEAYGDLSSEGVKLHAILANETDADYEGGLSTGQASAFHILSLEAYIHDRPQDVIHIPAPTGAPETHRQHLRRYKQDGWLVQENGLIVQDKPTGWDLRCSQHHMHPVVIDGHGYNGDLENVLNVLYDECPGGTFVITETNNLDDFSWPIELIDQGRASDIIYFILNWARGGEGRVQPPSKDDAEKRMSLLRFADRYSQFKATIRDEAGTPPSEPEEPVTPPTDPITPDPEIPDPWRFWTPDQLASITQCPIDSIEQNWPKLNEQLWHCGLADKATLIAMAARVPIETAHRFEPIHEFKNSDGSIPSWWYTYDGGPMYHGRGLLQNTHLYNYRSLGPAIASLWGAGLDDPTFDLVNNPDNLLDPDMSAAAAAIYFRDHVGSNGDTIPEAAARGDWRSVNVLIQGGTSGLVDLVQYATLLGGSIQPSVEEQIVYSRNVPDEVILQQNQWSCAVRSTYAGLWAMAQVGEGEPVTYGDGGPRDVYEWMVPSIDSNEGGGLHFGDGHELAAMLREHGYDSESLYPCTLDQVLERAGRQPVLIGGGNWNHWVYVRGKTSDGGLILENPSPGYRGITDYLRDSFDGSNGQQNLGPFAMVWISQRLAEPEQPPVDPTAPETDAEKIDRMTSAIGYLTGDILKGIEEIRASVDDGVGRPDEAPGEDSRSLAQFWANWDAGYAKLGAILDEMRRVGEEQLG